jgi:chemotaxis protein MotB
MGHTDNIPIKSKIYKSNWELSAYRGLSVLDYFLKEKGLSPSRFYVGGYGAFRPIYPNDTAKRRALNRRVEIIFKHIKEG